MHGKCPGVAALNEPRAALRRRRRPGWAPRWAAAALLVGTTGAACGSAPPPAAHVRAIPTFVAEPTTTAAPTTDPDPLEETTTPMPTWQHNHASTQQAAQALVLARGYTPVPGTTYGADGLRAIVATRTGLADAADQHAFFFHDGNFLGTDAAEASAGITANQSDPDTITLSYAIYHLADTQSGPTAGAASVRFHWDGDHLQPLDPIPLSDAHADGSRR